MELGMIVETGSYAAFLLVSPGAEMRSMFGIVPGSAIRGMVERSTAPELLEFERIG